MASNNIILAVPSANSSVNYELPENESATLSFTPEDIDGLKLNQNGGLEISFVEGGSVTLSNFQSFIDNGNTLSLKDGTQVDPKLLFNALGGQPDASVLLGDVTKIGIPAENSQRDITLEPGKKYFFNFDIAETTGADVKDGQMIIGFSNGGKIVVTNYESAMAGATPPELSLASKTCVVTGDELITNIQNLAKANVLEETVIVEEEEDAIKNKSKIAAADMQGVDDIGPGDETGLAYDAGEVKEAKAEDSDEGKSDAVAQKMAKVETAAGGEADIARQLASIETAAGGPAAGGRANSGYGYGSRAALDPFLTKPDIGPIDPTALGYRAPVLQPSKFLDQPEPNSNPIIAHPDVKKLDETNLAGGPISVSGSISVNYGTDSPGSIGPNGSFYSAGSQTGGQLSSNGVPVNVVVEGNGYAGYANGTKVFDLVIDTATGNYTFTQYEQLDHRDGSDPNDEIDLNFGVIVRDDDGDAAHTIIKIVVADDAPTASGAVETVDETNLGPIVETGSITLNYGQDGPGRVETTGSAVPSGSLAGGILSSGGVAIIISHTPTGYVGKAGDVVVFTLDINSTTGAYTYTQYGNLDHGNPNDPNDIITLTFGTKVIDYDGDSALADIVIHIKDDAPIFQPPPPPENPPPPPEFPPPPPEVPGNPTPDNGLEIVDESNLGPVVESGKLNADFGADQPGYYGFIPGSFIASGSLKDGNLTHNGVPVLVTLEGTTYVGKAGDKVIFTLELNTATGDYKFTLLDNFDHEDASNPDDIIALDFGVTAFDSEGDGANGSIRIYVKDDAPIANDDHNTYDVTFGVANGNVITGLNGGPGAADDLSTDATNTVVKIAFGANVVEVPATGTVSIDGNYGKLTIAADGTYTYELFDGVFPGTGGTGGSSQATYVAGDAAGTASSITKNGITIFSTNGADLTFVNEGDGDGIGIAGNGSNKIYNNEVLAITFDQNITKADITLADIGKNNVNTGIEYRVYVEGSATPISGEIGISSLTIVNGHVTFTLDSALLAPGKDITKIELYSSDAGAFKQTSMLLDSVKVYYPAEEVCITDEFIYTLQDGDGDQDPAKLTLSGKDLTDDVPVLKPAQEIVDETDLVGGVLVETGNIIVDYGHDVPGAITPNGSFTSTGSKLNDALTHQGTEVVISVVGNTYYGKAGDKTIFTLEVKPNGFYEFKLFDNLDHKDGSNPDDIINLNFGITATDGDGSTASTTIVVKVKDDAPVANNDVNTYDTNTGVATGNVVTGLNGGAGAADKLSTDASNTVTKIAFGTTVVNVPTTGTASIDGNFGTLKIAANGSYTYEAFTTGGGSATYVDKTFIAGPALPDFDEMEALDEVEQQSLGVAPGNLSVGSGDVVTVTFYKETATITNTLGVFSVKEDGTLSAETILIKDVNTATQGDTFSYTSATNASSIGFFIIADGKALNGNYAGIDLSKGALDFVYKHGTPDARPATIDDDGANISLVYISELGVETVLQGPMYFTSDRGDVSNLNADGTVRVVSGVPDGDTSTLRIGFEDLPNLGDKDYSDVVFDVSIATKDCGCNDSAIRDVFEYTLTDYDGDSDPATLTLTGKDMIDSKPIFTKPADEILDETNLKDGTLTETGKFVANFGADGPGTIEPNGTFSSSGSRLGDKLSSNGVAVQVTQVGNYYFGKAGTTTVFVLEVKPDGNYTFKLFENLDHKDASDPNDIINLHFGVTATDCDGDTAETKLTVKVKDDAPVANDDHNKFEFSVGEATGNVVTGLNGGDGAKDVLSQDETNTVTKISFGSNTVNVPGSGTATIEGTYGTLKIAANGQYTYTLKDGVSTGTGGYGGTSKASFVAADVAGTASSVTKNGITIYSLNGADLTFVNEGAGDGVGIAGLGSDKIWNGEVLGMTFSQNVAKVDITIADIGANNLTTGFEYKVYVEGSATPILGEVGIPTLTVVNGHVTFSLDAATLAPGKTITKVEIYSSNAGQYKQTSMVLDSIKAYYPPEEICIKDEFVYTLKDGDGDTDTATLTLSSCGTVAEEPVSVRIVADDACIKEDSQGSVPVHAYFTGGSGNETMIIVMSGLPSGWTVKSAGWVKTGSDFTYTLPQGVSNWTGEVKLQPPANSDADIGNLTFEALVYDPNSGNTESATDKAYVTVDAVIDPFKFSAGLQEHNSAPGSGKIFVMTNTKVDINSKIKIAGLTYPDNDGSESLLKIVFTLQDGMDNTTYISVKNGNGSYSKIGTKGTVGKDTTYTIDLSGMTYQQAKDLIENKLFLSNPGKSGLNGSYNLGIQIVSYEKNLSGIEKDYSDNKTSYTVVLPVLFCISPLVIDLDGDGIELLSQENGVLFDMTNDGVKEQTGWVAKDDGLLALDKNKDGIINDRSELFGNDETHENGFDALAAYDSNGDGVIDAKDAIFEDLKVWQDLNSDGISQEGELRSLSDVGIAAIKLKADNVEYNIAGNLVTHESEVVYTDGSTAKVVDAWFGYQDENGAGVDKGLTLVGTDGDDVIVGGAGSDHLYGGAGADTFLFQTISESVDTLKDFSAAEGDKIDLSQVISNFDPLTNAISDFVFAKTTEDGKTILSINTNGTGEDGAQNFAIIESANVSVADLFNNGNIVA